MGNGSSFGGLVIEVPSGIRMVVRKVMLWYVHRCVKVGIVFGKLLLFADVVIGG